MSKKTAQFSRSPTHPCPAASKVLPPPWLWTSNFERNPLPLAPLPPYSRNDNQSIKKRHDPRLIIICHQKSNYTIIHNLQWLLLTLPQNGHWPRYLRWLWLSSHRLLHTSFLLFPHQVWVQQQKSVDLVACAL